MRIETHAPYQLGSGWPTVNGGVKDECFVNPDTGASGYIEYAPNFLNRMQWSAVELSYPGRYTLYC